MNAVTKVAPSPVAILRPQSFSDLIKFAEMAARSGMVPKDYIGKPEAIVIAVQMGSELGLAPMQSLQNIACVNGRPSVWGDALLGLCRQSPLCQDIKEWLEGDGDNLTAYCEAHRAGATPVAKSFSVTDAKKAGLWSKSIWQQYPKRMLQMRARGFALRDAFPDVLRGLISVEEARDIPAEDFRGTTLEAKPIQADTTSDPTETSPASAAEPKREAPKRTIGDVLADLEAEIESALKLDHPRPAMDALLARPDIKKLEGYVQGEGKKRFEHLVDNAYKRISERELTTDEGYTAASASNETEETHAEQQAA